MLRRKLKQSKETESESGGEEVWASGRWHLSRDWKNTRDEPPQSLGWADSRQRTLQKPRGWTEPGGVSRATGRPVELERGCGGLWDQVGPGSPQARVGRLGVHQQEYSKCGTFKALSYGRGHRGQDLLGPGKPRPGFLRVTQDHLPQNHLG